MRTFAVTAVLLLTAGRVPAGDVWPGADWETATPASQGMSAAGLDAAAAYAEQAGGGSGCVIRHGYLVREWGPADTRWDIKSATKGTLGATLLGLAIDRKLVALDDPARKHYPAIGTELPGNDRNWLAEITVRHLATMTAGFDDGRPPKLVYRPGTKGIYSNDTANMLAELLTLRFGEDLSTVLQREVMGPIGMPADAWRWRANQYRPKEVGGITSREFASGLTITHRGLARIGYLYLRGGRWKDKQILSPEYVRTATRPTVLPAPWPYYAFYWGSNGNGTFKDMPRVTFWALGLGDSVVVVCPSLDLVAVRCGLGSTKSQLPGGDDWGARVEGFFRLVVRSVQGPPPSPVIRDIRWAPADTVIRLARGSDNWPMTWGDDDALYTAYGDGWGFDPRVPDKLSLGFARVTGNPPNVRGENIRSATGEQKGDGKAGKKASGILMVDGVLYLWVRNAGNAQLAWSMDHGKTWTWADWKLTTSFGCPTFLNFGRNYAGARDNFVYVFSPDADGAYDPADRMVLARVPKDRIRDRDAYEFFRGLGPDGPLWSKDVAERGAALADAGRCYRSMVSYDAGLKRYLWCVTLPLKEKDKKGSYGLTVYDAAEPWGPWTLAYRADPWDTDAGESCGFPTKWISPDGKTLHLVFAGGDAFNVRRAELVLHEPGK